MNHNAGKELIMKKVIRLCICLALCLSLSLSLLCPASAEVPSVIAPEVLEYMEKAEDSALIPIWVFQKSLTEKEKDALFEAEIPDGLSVDDYIMATRAILKREYSAITAAFVEKYCDEQCKVLFRSKYTSTVIVEVPKETVWKIAEDPQVIDIGLYVDEPLIPTESLGGSDPALSSSIEAEIKETYFQLHEDPMIQSPEDVSIIKYYGNYHGYEIVHMCGFGLGIPASGTLELGGLEFRFANITDIDDFLAYRNGEFLEVRLLYEDGLLTQEDITNLWLTHQDIPLSKNPFEDVSVTAWYYKGLRYCYDRGIMVGVDDHHFEPDAPMTRAMLVTVLWRMAGRPEAAPSTFSDVKKGTWYSEAVGWAEATGVVNGIGGGKFGPEQNITREQIATILYRYSGSPSVQGSLSAYRDFDAVSNFAAEGMRWATLKRIVNGVPSDGITILAPQELASRAQVAAIIMRYLES